MIPAGLIDSNIELFADGENLMAIYNGSVTFFNKLPVPVLRKLFGEMRSNPEAIDCLKKMGYTSLGKMLERFCWCRFGAFDSTPDLAANNSEFNTEYWDCGQRDNCPYQFTLCDKVRCGNAYLTKKEILVVQLIAAGFPDKQICEQINTTYQTVITHKKNIYKKPEAHSQAEITAFAYKNNLV